MYFVDENHETAELKAYVVGEGQKLVEVGVAYVVNKNKQLDLLWSSETGRLLWCASDSANYHAKSNAAWSDDGIVWNQITFPYRVCGMRYDNGYFVVYGVYGGTNIQASVYVSYSKDCITWTHKSFYTYISGTTTPYFGYMNGRWWLYFLRDTNTYGSYVSDDLATWAADDTGNVANAIYQCFDTITAVVGGKEYYIQKKLGSSGYVLRYCLTSNDVTKSANWTNISLSYSYLNSVIGTKDGLFVFGTDNSTVPYFYIRKYADSFNEYVYGSYQLKDSNSSLASTVYNPDAKEILSFSDSYNPTRSFLMKFEAADLARRQASLIEFPSSGFMPNTVVYKADEKKYVANPVLGSSDKQLGYSSDGITWTVGGDAGLSGNLNYKTYGLVQ